MLSKILKYDLKYIYKTLIIYYILVAIAALLSYFLPKISPAPFFQISGTIFQNVTLSLAVATVVTGLMRLWVNFQQKFYGDPSYLYHTLPVSRRTLFQSKIIAAMLVTLTNLAVCIAAMLVAYAIIDDFSAIIVDKFAVFATAETPTWTIISAILLTIYMEFLFISVMGYVCIIAAYNSGVKNNLRAIIVGLAGYLGTQALSVLGIYLAALADPQIMVLFKGGVLTTLMPPIYIALFINTAAVAVCYIAAQTALRRRLNVI